MKGYKAKSALGNVHGAKSGGDQAQAPKCPLPVESDRLGISPPKSNCDTTCDMVFISRNSLPQAPIGGWSRRHPLPRVYQESRLPDG